MSSLNKVFLLGNLTRDVQMRFTPGGTAVAEIGMAMNERRKQGEEWIEETVFVDVTLWGRTAEVASEFLSKGSPVLIEGKLKLDTWEKDGVKQYKLKVTAERMQMVGARGESGGGGSGGGSSGNSNSGGNRGYVVPENPNFGSGNRSQDDSDIPF